jgi:hypothetical protein
MFVFFTNLCFLYLYCHHHHHHHHHEWPLWNSLVMDLIQKNSYIQGHWDPLMVLKLVLLQALKPDCLQIMICCLIVLCSTRLLEHCDSSLQASWPVCLQRDYRGIVLNLSKILALWLTAIWSEKCKSEVPFSSSSHPYFHPPAATHLTSLPTWTAPSPRWILASGRWRIDNRWIALVDGHPSAGVSHPQGDCRL